ncbi:HAD family hydrolase [Propionibacteriaceae bacterium Y1923]|uniref:HAD family hydrolase n=1 Tax=Aestuariimicrobium sp. Y1814 TaxID=3418742 RepID=UPI003C1F3511
MQIPAEMANVTTLCFDVDGTLTDADHQVSQASLEALRKLDAAGLTLIIVSGRHPYACAKALHDAGLHGWTSAANGALNADIATGEVLRRDPVPADLAAQVIELCRTEQVPLAAFRDEDILWQAGAEGDEWLLHFLPSANEGIVPIPTDLREVDPATILKLMPGTNAERMAEFFPLVRELTENATLSLDEACEVTGPHSDKEDGVRFLLEHLNIDPATVAGAGDGGNDVRWLSSIGWPMAMENARPEVKEVATMVLPHHLEEGVAQFVDAFLAARG